MLSEPLFKREARQLNWAFIDGQNLHLGTTRSDKPWKIDLEKFRIYLEQKYSVEKAFYFIGTYISKNTDLYNALRKYGYNLVFREHDSSMKSSKKGNVDTDIVFSIMKSIIDKESYSGIVLVTGDGDYWRMVDFLINRDIFKKLLVPNRKKVSSFYLAKMPDTFRVFLDDVNIKKKIKR